MNDLEFSSYLVSRVCHDLVGPLGAVVNGLEVLEDERDHAMRADALKIVTSSAAQALARLQFMRIAFGAAGSAGAELDLGEVNRLVGGLLSGGKVAMHWEAPSTNWPKDWAKLVMNVALIAADCLPRGGTLRIETGSDAGVYGFKIVAAGQGARIVGGIERALRGETAEEGYDARGVQPYLTYRLAKKLNAGLTMTAHEGCVELVAG
ncbi:MAG: histidine phosphotransferase [Alphaproteobacteria bacterium]|nr:histidine phosphotransferase [Alphaproteobacteria bacterium]MDE2629370.1 histidine phosphotransferase [Alphaproteobacteria bacterium]